MGRSFWFLLQQPAALVKPPRRDHRSVAHVVVPDDQKSGYCRSRSIAIAKPQYVNSLPSCDRDVLLAGHECRIAEDFKIVRFQLSLLVGSSEQLANGDPIALFDRTMCPCQDGFCFITGRRSAIS